MDQNFDKDISKFRILKFMIFFLFLHLKISNIVFFFFTFNKYIKHIFIVTLYYSHKIITFSNIISIKIYI